MKFFLELIFLVFIGSKLLFFLFYERIRFLFYESILIDALLHCFFMRLYEMTHKPYILDGILYRCFCFFSPSFTLPFIHIFLLLFTT